jgi:hypothetical protein
MPGDVWYSHNLLNKIIRVQIKNGAYIHHEDEKEFYTRVRKNAELVFY